MAEYWFDETLGDMPRYGELLELRGSLTLQFVEHWGMVSGHVEREDSGRRAVLDLMPVEKVIERATSMADGLVAALEQRGWIKPATRTAEETAAQLGKLEKIKGDAQYDRENEQQKHIMELQQQLSDYRRKEWDALEATAKSSG